MVTFKKYKKSYNVNTVLSIDELNIPAGTHWIKGENGAGKTTLFKSLAGLLPHDGDISFDDGISIKNHPVLFRQFVNYGEAEPIYPGSLTAKDLARFIGQAKNCTKQEQDFLIAHFGIADFQNKSCRTYSSGMLKKVSLALAFMGKPRIIILDEPLITLDEHARNLLFAAIQKTSEKGVSFFISSHQPLTHASFESTNTYTIANKTLACA